MAVCAIAVSSPGLANVASAQSLGNAGTIEGTVLDPSGAAVPNAAIVIRNLLTSYKQSTSSVNDGTFRLVNIPPNPYHLEAVAPGFNAYSEDVIVKGSVPTQCKVTLSLAGTKTTVTVEANGTDLVELDPTSHVDIDRSQLLKLPAIDPGAGLSQAVIYSAGGVAADGNGFFHPLGDHAQVTFVIDGQPISDQQSKVFSTQLPASAIQGMELMTGAPVAEFGDKTSLVAQITTRSGLGANKVFGNLDTSYGSFGTGGGSVGLGFGKPLLGNFFGAEATRSGRFLDTPEFLPQHDTGNNESIFDRLDFQPRQNDALHLNLFSARNWIQIPNSFDQLSQDQRQRVFTWSVAPGYQHTFNVHTLLTLNPYVRKDEFFYYGSRDPFQDTPATQSQARQLLDWGIKADLSISHGHHTVKLGIDGKQTRLRENFGFGITDERFNPVCVDSNGAPAGRGSLINPGECGGLGLRPNPNFSAGLLAYDLTRGGRQFFFHGAKAINQVAAYVQDSITAGNLQLSLGFRADRYMGITTNSGAEPRAGVAYNLKRTGTVLRAAYSRTFETPFNENLLLSSLTGSGGLAQNVFGSNVVPISPGIRNQYNAGMQQAIGKYVLVEADYFWKFTTNGFDFSTLLNTTVTFPISWHKSKVDGVTGRVSTINMKGFQAYWTFGHTRARYFFPEAGGLIPQGTPLDGSVFRIDHDQVFQSSSVFRYQHKAAEWIAVTWRYDSGLVVSGVPDSSAALDLTANQQVTLKLACYGVFATATAPLSSCNGPVTSELITLPQAGQENDDHNPDRVRPRHIFNLGIGTDNLLRKDVARITASIEVANIANKVALYNFLSTFSGTHFMQPRSVLARVGIVF